MDKGAWQATVHGVARVKHYLATKPPPPPPKFCLSPIYPTNTEKAMAPHSNTLAWKIPWMEDPGRPQSMGSLGVGHY